ncbi:MAG: acetylornithine/succinylornithine family transaminase [Blastochloris sp.]|nr:acetylornithine/succinylornithine family transaminase [Blastochloris sp.]
MKNPESAEQIKATYENYVVPSYARSLVLAKGTGCRVWDVDGKEYLDFGGGIAVNCLGHSHPAMVRALSEQSQQLIHCSNLYYHAGQGKLAQEIVRLTGGGKVFFCNSGAEANEGLFKLARKAMHDQGKYEVITTLNSFHGRTMAGIAATGQDKVKKGFEPLMPGFIQVPYNDIEAMTSAITERTAAIMIEGIQGEGGITSATPDYLLALRKLTQEKGILLLLDAVQCGFFRTGCFQSYQRILEGISGGENFRPDGISMAKSLGGGFPIGAVWIDQAYADVLQPGTHGTTYGGTPLACAVSLAILEEIESKKLSENIRILGDYLKAELKKLQGRHSILEVRGMGFMLGLLMEGDVTLAGQKLREAGLLLIPATGNILRFLPPYNITRAEIDQALGIIRKTL